MNLRLSLFFALASTLAAQPAAPHWVTTWATAQPLIRPAASQPQTGQPPRGFANQTVRMIVRSSVAGSKLRIKLSSPFGATPVTIGGAHIALRKKDAEIVPASDRALTFNGKPSVTLGPGMVMLSDPLDFPVAPQADLAVSLWFPTETGPPSAHGGLRTSYVSKEGDFLAATDIAAPDQGNAAKRPQYFYLESLEVTAPADVATIGQYLQPSRRNLQVAEYVTPEQFERYRMVGLSLGFKMVFSGPLVRSSYMADMVEEAARA